MIGAMILLLGATLAPDKGANTSVREAERITAAFARCEVKSKSGRSAALAFTREIPGPTLSKYRDRVLHSSCAPNNTNMTFAVPLMRAALFSALYERDFAKVPLSVATIATDDDYTSEFDGPPYNTLVVLRRFGDCVVAADGERSRRIVLSELYSTEEAAAFSELQPALSGCVEAGPPAHFSRTVLRGAIAEALYKMSARAGAKVN